MKISTLLSILANYVLRQARTEVGVLSRHRNLISCKAKVLLYKSLILPYLTYCHLTWHFCKSSDKRKLERIQERALRVIYQSHSATYEELLRRSDISSSVYNRRLQDITIFMYTYLCTKSNMVLYLTAFLNYLSAKALHTRYGIVTLYYHVLKLFVMASTLLDISGRSHGQLKLNENQRDSPSLGVFINKIRILNLGEIIIN